MQIFEAFPSFSSGTQRLAPGCYGVLCPSSVLCHAPTSLHVSEDTGFSTGELGRGKDWTFSFDDSFWERILRKLLNSLMRGKR